LGGDPSSGAGRTVYLKNLGADAAATIQAALDNPRVTCVVLPAGEIGIGSTITIPSGKTLMGAGKEFTTLVALEDFHSTLDVPFPGVMIFADGASQVTVSGLTLDGAKVGLSSTGEIVGKVSGIVMYNTSDFLIQDVHVENVTGYAQWAVGSWNYSNPELSVFSSGKYVDCSTANANVHFEQTTAAGVHILRSSSVDGDGDIPTEAYLHPMIGSTDIVYEDVFVRGTGDGIGASIFSLGVPIGTVTFINPDIVTDNNGMTIGGSQAAPVALVIIQGGSVESTGGIGILSSWTTDIAIVDASISGYQIGILTYDGSIHGINSSSEAWTEAPDMATYALAHSGVGTADWLGPLVSTSTNGPEFNYSGVVAWHYDGAYRDYLGAALPQTEQSLAEATEAGGLVAAVTADEPTADTSSAAALAADTGSLPFAGNLAPAQSTAELGRVLAEALDGTPADAPDIDTLLSGLGDESRTDLGATIAGNDGAGLSWAASGAGSFGGFGAFQIDATLFHQDAVPPA
jgi:hypothetical protein